MERNNCIKNIKSEVNAKISSHTFSEKDYIVFRPKSYVYNQILSDHSKIVTSIFKLQNSRKSQSSLVKHRSKKRKIQQQNADFSEKLQIQKSQNFIKFQPNKQKTLRTLETDKIQASRSKLKIQQTQDEQSKKQVRLHRNKNKNSHCLLFEIQKKKKIDSLLFHKKNKQLDYRQKQNFSNSININHLRPIHKDKKTKELLGQYFSHQKITLNRQMNTAKYQDFLNHSRQSKIKIQIQGGICWKGSANIVEKKQISQKQCQNSVFCKLLHRQKEYQKQICENYAFEPWQTNQIFQTHEETLSL